MDQFRTTWHDSEREPQCPPDPRFPNGIHIDASGGAGVVCSVNLPYPAKRCGLYEVECTTCGRKVAVTTAGRPDDPRSILLGCRPDKVAPSSQQPGRPT